MSFWNSPRFGFLKRIPALAWTLALVALCALGAWYVTHDGASGSRVAAKSIPKRAPLSLKPPVAYDLKLTDREKQVLRSAPKPGDRASLKQYLLAKAKLEPNPLVRKRIEQEAVKMTDGYGSLAQIKPDNPQAASVLEALKSGDHPERLSVMMAPTPFSASAYRDNPAAYLNVSEPGRVFQTHPASPDTPQIQAITPYFQMVNQGASVDLAVKAAPGTP